MRGKPAGSIVRLAPFRWFDEGQPMLGMYFVSEAGSGYEVVGIEETSRSGPENHPRFFNLVCVKTEPSEIPPQSLVCSIEWEPRFRRRAR